MFLRDFLLALGFLTRIPVSAQTTAAGLAGAKSFFPAVGVIIGIAVAIVCFALHASGPWVAALAGLAVWIGITGALHLDGLADVADALGAAHGDPERFHAVLKDPHVGSFAVTAVCLQVVAKLVLLAQLATGAFGWGLVLVPAWARWGVLVWSGMLPALRPGLGQSIAAEPRWGTALAWAVVLALASVAVAPPMLAALVLVPAIVVYWQKKIGGVTGDCLGASIEVMETLLLLALAVRL